MCSIYSYQKLLYFFVVAIIFIIFLHKTIKDEIIYVFYNKVIQCNALDHLNLD